MKKKLYGRSVWRTVTCPHEECEADFDVIYTPALKARTYGPPENCYEGEPAEIDWPTECPECGGEITEADADRWLLKVEGQENEVDDENPFQGDRYGDRD
jgi:hypothetical protein